jgi:hypothetical protein
MSHLRKMGLDAWLVLLAVLCFGLGGRNVKAVSGCDAAYNPQGLGTTHICWNNLACAPDQCERDRCKSDICGAGYEEYCISASYRGQFLSCEQTCP